MAEFIHPTGPCADCGKPIANSHWYYAGGRDGKKEGYYHSTCGDPLGIKSAVAAERERCATVALEQRCERGTPWDLACVTIAEKIRAQSTYG